MPTEVLATAIGQQPILELDLTILHVSAEETTHLDDSILSRMGTHEVVTANSATAAVEGTDSSNCWLQLKERIERFVKAKDRYLALVSLLMKSQAYYHHHRQREIHDPSNRQLSRELGEEGICRRPIMDLPRTAYNKPYLPDAPSANNLSISHQYPYIAMIRLIASDAEEVMEKNVKQRGDSLARRLPPPPAASSTMKVGIDVVVFDPINSQLYATVNDFLAVFRDSLAPIEWQQLMHNNDTTWTDQQRLQEFYLLWAMKEAYTKALGLGMHCPFDQFSTSLSVLNGAGSEPRRLAPLIFLPPSQHHRLVTYGTVHHHSTDVRETWCFAFQALQCDRDKPSTPGCACICVGPMKALAEDVHSVLSIDESWCTLDDLLAFHGIIV